jgi:hypothetical protein
VSLSFGSYQEIENIEWKQKAKGKFQESREIILSNVAKRKVY